MSQSFGVIYVATGNDFVLEAQESARSCKAVMPDIPIHLWTDVNLNNVAHPFDKVQPLENPKNGFVDKIGPLYQTPFEKTLFVDTDTYFCNPVYDLITLLDRFDLAYCHAPRRVCPGENNILDDVPSGFPEPNTGVIAFRSTRNVLSVLKKWEKSYLEKMESDRPPTNDQSVLRQELWESKLNTTVLPCEYNIRTIFPVFVGGNCDVKILHGRGETLSNAKKLINNKRVIRIYNFRPSPSLSVKLKKPLVKLLQKYTNYYE